MDVMLVVLSIDGDFEVNIVSNLDQLTNLWKRFRFSKPQLSDRRFGVGNSPECCILPGVWGNVFHALKTSSG